MADKKKMSVAEILAAARKEKGGGAAPAPAPEAAPVENVAPAAAAESESAEAVAAAPQPAAKPAAKVKPGSMSVAEMLAAARAQAKGGGAPAEKKAPAAKAAPQPAAVPKPQPAAAKKAEPAAKPAAPAKAPTIDTTSILAAARGAGKPGPMSKAEAAAKGAVAAPEKSGKKKLEVPPMPTKPSFAAKATPAEVERRGFFGYLVAVVLGSALSFGFASLAVTNLMWVLGLARYLFPNILTEPPSRFKVGSPDVLGLGQVDEKYKAQFGVWIVKAEYEGQSQIFALKTVCTHLGCTPNWLEAEQKFKCPCHGSGFYKDGVNFEGPAPRPLERYAIRLADDGQLEVDKSRVFHEELGQWKDSASYVPA